MIIQNSKQSLKMNLQNGQQIPSEEYYLTDSRLNQFYKEAYNNPDQHDIYQSDNELQALIQSTLNLQYEKSLSQQTLHFYTSILYQKQIQIKKIKEIYNKKKKKMHLLTEQLNKVSLQINEKRQGLKGLKAKRQQCINKRNKQRNVRLQAQQHKSIVYHKYCQLQSRYGEIQRQIQQYKEVQEQLNEIVYQNQMIIKQIQGLQNKRQEQSTITKQKVSKKDSLKMQIKKMYEKLKHLQKQDQHIKHQFQTNKQILGRMQREQEYVNNKNSQMQSLYKKIEQLKQQIKEKRWCKQQKQKDGIMLSQQESILRKEVALESQYKQSRNKIKQDLKVNVRHNFKIIDSEADEQHNKYSRKIKQRQHNQSHEQFDSLINRFQQIKSKSKIKIGQ